MIIVPEKTIAVVPIIPNDGIKPFNMDFSTFLKPLNIDHKRDWFTPNFYRCLPLSIGNMQGFVFSSPHSLDVIWNGGMHPNDIKISYHFDQDMNTEEYLEMNHVHYSTEFGNGILTAHIPVMLKTPPGVNLMTIAPPNFPVPGISPMTGVVETDNLRFTFTLNFKIDIPNITIQIKKDYPLMGLLPIPRYFCDSFNLVNAYDIIDHELIQEEMNIVDLHAKERDRQNYKGESSPRRYYKGEDFYGNKFSDHQLPRKQQ